MNQVIQQEQENRVIAKAMTIAIARRVRKCKANRNIWLVGSGNPKTQKVFYCVMWDDGLDAFVCDCKSFQFGNNPCVHVYACAIAEGSND